MPAPTHPWVDLTYGHGYQVCAEGGHKEFPEPHFHAKVWARANGVRPLPGDRIVFNVGKEQATFPAEVGVVSLEFPAGLGVHVVVVDWVDSAGQVKAESQATFSVWDCSEPSL